LGGIPAIPSTDLTNEINRIVVSPLGIWFDLLRRR